MTKNPKHLKTTAEHHTPRAIVEAARRVLGRIDLDPMSNAAAQRIIHATTYYTKDDDGFLHDWSGTTFLNPAGGLVKPAWQKLMTAYGQGDVPAFVWIGFSLEQLQTLQRDINPRARALYPGPTPIEFPICIPYARLAFEDVHGVPQDSPTHANYICYGGPDIAAFVREFSAWGVVSVPMVNPRVLSSPTAAALRIELARAQGDSTVSEDWRTVLDACLRLLQPPPVRDDVIIWPEQQRQALERTRIASSARVAGVPAVSAPAATPAPSTNVQAAS